MLNTTIWTLFLFFFLLQNWLMCPGQGLWPAQASCLHKLLKCFFCLTGSVGRSEGGGKRHVKVGWNEIRKQNKKPDWNCVWQVLFLLLRNSRNQPFRPQKRSPTSHAKDVLWNWWLNLPRICILILRMFIDNLINGLFPFIAYLELVLQSTEKAHCSETWLRDQDESTHGLQNPTPRVQPCSSRNAGPEVIYQNTSAHVCTCENSCVLCISVIADHQKKPKALLEFFPQWP